MLPFFSRKYLIEQLSWQKISIIILKWTIFVITILYLYKRVWQEEKFEDIISRSADLIVSPAGALLFFITFSLLFVNWGFEAMKWRLLVKDFNPVSFPRSFFAVLAGTSVSLWVPNRSGEYLGRIFFLREGSRIKGILATLVGSVSQLMVTIIMGVCGLIYFLNQQVSFPLLAWMMLFVGVLLILLLLLVYFNIGKIRHFIPRRKLLKPLKRYLLVYSRYSMEDLIRVFIFSLLRYMVFTTQYYLLLRFFQVDIGIIPAFLVISLVYLVQTVIPSNILTELGIRGVAIVSFFGFYELDDTSLLAASYTLWLVNLMLPAIAGVFILLFARLSQTAKTA